MRTKYVTIQEAVSIDRNKLIGTRVLILPESVIDTMLKAGRFRLKDRQVWHTNIPVFMDCTIKLPEDANFVNVRKIELDELKDNKRRLNKWLTDWKMKDFR